MLRMREDQPQCLLKTSLDSQGKPECYQYDENRPSDPFWYVRSFGEPMPSTTLSCGADHQSVLGTTGYEAADGPDHWCKYARDVFFNDGELQAADSAVSSD